MDAVHSVGNRSDLTAALLRSQTGPVSSPQPLVRRMVPGMDRRSMTAGVGSTGGDGANAACTKNPFYDRHRLTGSDVFFAIEEACLDETADIDARLMYAADTDANRWEASYTIFEVIITIHAVHLAASMGSIRVMDWLRRRCNDSHILDRRAMLQNVHSAHRRPHYTPLMSALFMSKAEAAIWLLDQGVSATAQNADEMTPCHLLARLGLPQHSADTRLKALEGVATKLVEKSADLDARSGKLEHRNDKAAEEERDKTPLQMAADRSSAYPKQALHLLTKSFHRPAKSELFKEVHLIALANPTAAEVLLEKMQERDIGEVKRQLLQEVMENVDRGEHMSTFVRTLNMSPSAGSRLLELLMIEPKVSNPQRYPLPLYTVLPNGQMLSTYQPAEDGKAPVWESGKEKDPPRWHTEFRKDLPNDPLLHTNVYEVSVRVLHLPGIINLRVLSILSMLQREWHHMVIFGKIPVAGMVTCIWSHVVTLFYFLLVWEFSLLAVLLAMGIYPPPPDYAASHAFVYSVILAHLMCAVANLLWGCLKCRALTGLPMREYVIKLGKGEISSILGLALLLYIRGMPLLNVPVESGVAKTMIVVNILLRCFGLMSMFRVVPLIGPLIIAALHSFIPMRGMFMFMGMVFTSFSFAFIIFRDEDRSVSFVLVYLYQALVLADRDASVTISGLDIAHEQTYDFQQQMFTGGGDEWVLLASLTVMLLASSVFSLVLLNLTIAMYTNFYEQMEPMAVLIFQQQRAKQCVVFMLQPTWQFSRQLRRLTRRQPPADPSQPRSVIHFSWRRLLVLLAAVTFLLYAAAVLRSWPVEPCSVLLFLVVQLFQAALVFNVADMDERQHFLWVSYRTDYESQFLPGDPQKAKVSRRPELTERAAGAEVDLAQVRREVQSLSRDVAGVREAVAQLLARLPPEPPHRPVPTPPPSETRATLRG